VTEEDEPSKAAKSTDTTVAAGDSALLAVNKLLNKLSELMNTELSREFT